MLKNRLCGLISDPILDVCFSRRKYYSELNLKHAKTASSEGSSSHFRTIFGPYLLFRTTRYATNNAMMTRKVKEKAWDEKTKKYFDKYC